MSEGVSLDRCVCCAGVAVVPVGTVLNAPAIPLTERMITPVPAVTLEDDHDVVEVLPCAVTWSPADGAEFTDVNMDIVLPLEIHDWLHRFLKSGFVPLLAVDRAGIIHSRSIAFAHTLLCELPRDVHVDAVNYVRHGNTNHRIDAAKKDMEPKLPTLDNNIQPRPTTAKSKNQHHGAGGGKERPRSRQFLPASTSYLSRKRS